MNVVGCALKIFRKFGFNRYMVECESILITKNNNINSVLIDTWWNVNVNKSNQTQASKSF